MKEALSFLKDTFQIFIKNETENIEARINFTGGIIITAIVLLLFLPSIVEMVLILLFKTEDSIINKVERLIYFLIIAVYFYKCSGRLSSIKDKKSKKVLSNLT